MPHIAKQFDPMELLGHFLIGAKDVNRLHLLSYPFLFPTTSLVTYFRALNYSNMLESTENALATDLLITRLRFGHNNATRIYLSDRLAPATASHLVLNVSRDDVLTDGLNQVWRREKRELMRPLRVRMGMDEGEEGVDLGGVSQEFLDSLLRRRCIQTKV